MWIHIPAPQTGHMLGSRVLMGELSWDKSLRCALQQCHWCPYGKGKTEGPRERYNSHSQGERVQGGASLRLRSQAPWSRTFGLLEFETIDFCCLRKPFYTVWWQIKWVKTWRKTTLKISKSFCGSHKMSLNHIRLWWDQGEIWRDWTQMQSA